MSNIGFLSCDAASVKLVVGGDIQLVFVKFDLGGALFSHLIMNAGTDHMKLDPVVIFIPFSQIQMMSKLKANVRALLEKEEVWL